ncbi:amino acid adenylation domain-containing protein [Nonomuraea endophytica]|uniref:amino acid adenylation domain-containing protein n=1 Tax=Nonomuraea endophytica TaxID=714136 RepID=UPI0037CB6582
MSTLVVPEHREFRAEWLAESIPARFLAAARTHPDRPALDGLSYAELARRAGRVAAAVRGARRVALLLDHGAQTIAAILGTLGAGAAYVPLDPRYPLLRLRRMAALAGADVVLTSPGHLALAGELLEGCRVVDVTALAEESSSGWVPVDPDSAAYILFTSGSTGDPKGVVQTHRGVLFQVAAHTNNLRIGPCDRVSVLSSFSFDMAVTDTFSALLNGACVVPVDVRTAGLSELAAAAREITIYHSTPTVFRYLVDALEDGERLSRMRAIVLGGEAVVGADLERFGRHFGDSCVLVNGYGATEISFAVQNHLTQIDAALVPAGVVPIGHPLPGTRVTLEPAGPEGQIVIRSPYLADYWCAPAGDAARFGTDPDGTRFYLTGDLGRLLPDGRIAYLGRLDRQVKIRGHRVELGEVEAALSALPGVSKATVVARGEHLHAYVIAESAAGIRDALSDVLPEYMLPTSFTALSAFPLTPTGKVDTSALPTNRPVTTASTLTALEEVIAEAWRTALDLPQVPRDQNFFDTGGHSLLMAKVQLHLETALGRRLPLTTLYTHPTIATLAHHLTQQPTSEPIPSAKDPTDRMTRRRQSRRDRPTPP